MTCSALVPPCPRFRTSLLSAHPVRSSGSGMLLRWLILCSRRIGPRAHDQQAVVSQPTVTSLPLRISRRASSCPPQILLRTAVSLEPALVRAFASAHTQQHQFELCEPSAAGPGALSGGGHRFCWYLVNIRPVSVASGLGYRCACVILECGILCW